MDDNEMLAIAAAIAGAIIGTVLGVILVIFFFGGLPK
jgi:flagellar motor component MotA